MIAYRQRGFINFYIILITLVAVGLLFGYAVILPWIPRIDLSPNVNLGAYALAILVGILASTGLLQKRMQNLTTLTVGAAWGLAARQVVYVGACVFALMFAIKDREVSRLFLGSYLFMLTGTLAVLHAWFPTFFARLLFADKARLATLFVGRTVGPGALRNWVSERRHLGLHPAGYLADSSTEGEVSADLPHLGTLSDLAKTLQERRISQVILLEWLDDVELLERIAVICEGEGCRLLIHNNFATQFARQLVDVEEGGEHFMALQEEPLEDPLSRAFKRALDIAVSLPVVVFVIPPLTLWVWLMLRWQAPGPVFFAKPRGGQNRKEFVMLKYRSMYAEEFDVNKQATPRDSRIFPFGRFLRKTSLDEFPQFINVLKGEMSVVGPRPHLPQHDDEFSRMDGTYRVRSLVKPGITGLAQVNGFRGEITEPNKLHRRVYWDLYYVSHWSWWLDVRIIFRTAWQVIFPPKTAY